MTTIVMTMPSPTAKRCFDAALEPSTPDPSTYNKDLSVQISDVRNGDSSRSHTTAESVAKEDYDSNISTPLSSAAVSPSPQHATMKAPASASKNDKASANRQKLTPHEKEVQRLEKELKEQQRTEEKLKKIQEKEEEKRRKEEEKRRKEEERVQKQKEREEEKEKKQKEKDEEKQRKEAERVAKEKEKEEAKAKKDRSQLRLNAFFGKKDQAASSQGSSRRGSVVSVEQDQAVPDVVSNAASEFEKAFPPFFLHAHTTVAPVDWFPWGQERLKTASQSIDQAIDDARHGHEPMDTISPKRLKRTLDDALSMPPAKRQKPLATGRDVKTLQARIQGGSESCPIDPDRAYKDSLAARKALSKTSMKFLCYHEDVRPPYMGTYTKRLRPEVAVKLPRNPFYRGLPEVHYDYDSEGEWEEPEEGEYLGSDDEEEEEEEDANEMDDFLDDAEDHGKPVANKRHMMGDLEPVSTGLLWTDEPSSSHPEVAYGLATLDISQFRIAPLLTTAIGTIDPYSTAFWETPAEPESKIIITSATMAPPPRGPLNPISGAANLLIPNVAATSTTTTGKTAAKAKAIAKPLPLELLEDFKQAVNGSDLTKVGLVEVLKKKFPQVNSKTIQQTLEEVGKREGVKAANKKWVLI